MVEFGRDKLGRHDGVLHGGRWYPSPVKLIDVTNVNQLATAHHKGKGKKGAGERGGDELEEQLGKGTDKLNFNYWKRSIQILEDQIRINRLALRRKVRNPSNTKRTETLNPKP